MFESLQIIDDGNFCDEFNAPLISLAKTLLLLFIAFLVISEGHVSATEEKADPK